MIVSKLDKNDCKDCSNPEKQTTVSPPAACEEGCIKILDSECIRSTSEVSCRGVESNPLNDVIPVIGDAVCMKTLADFFVSRLEVNSELAETLCTGLTDCPEPCPDYTGETFGIGTIMRYLPDSNGAVYTDFTPRFEHISNASAYQIRYRIINPNNNRPWTTTTIQIPAGTNVGDVISETLNSVQINTTCNSAELCVHFEFEIRVQCSSTSLWSAWTSFNYQSSVVHTSALHYICPRFVNASAIVVWGELLERLILGQSNCYNDTVYTTNDSAIYADVYDINDSYKGRIFFTPNNSYTEYVTSVYSSPNDASYVFGVVGNYLSTTQSDFKPVTQKIKIAPLVTKPVFESLFSFTRSGSDIIITVNNTNHEIFKRLKDWTYPLCYPSNNSCSLLGGKEVSYNSVNNGWNYDISSPSLACFDFGNTAVYITFEIDAVNNPNLNSGIVYDGVLLINPNGNIVNKIIIKADTSSSLYQLGLTNGFMGRVVGLRSKWQSLYFRDAQYTFT